MQVFKGFFIFWQLSKITCYCKAWYTFKYTFILVGFDHKKSVLIQREFSLDSLRTKVSFEIFKSI